MRAFGLGLELEPSRAYGWVVLPPSTVDLFVSLWKHNGSTAEGEDVAGAFGFGAWWEARRA